MFKQPVVSPRKTVSGIDSWIAANLDLYLAMRNSAALASMGVFAPSPKRASNK